MPIWDTMSVAVQQSGRGALGNECAMLTVVELKQAFWNADQPSLLKRDAVVVRKDAIGGGRLASSYWADMSDRGKEARRRRTYGSSACLPNPAHSAHP